ncbi:MAG: GxxExxY protein [Sphingopyxis solisilvae]|uniref:GxxExxY protein n=1 Tax=Sphingopyxis solisilvae TaxID=1886788 RepID=UPI0040371D23
MDIERLCTIVVDAGFNLHKDIGPGLLESAYETMLAAKLGAIGLKVDRQMPIDLLYDGVAIPNAFRLDLLIDDCLIIEIKSTEATLPVHAKQVVTYLRLMGLTHGFVMNFGTPTFKEGVRRLLNEPSRFVSSCLRVNKSGHAR